MPRGPPCAATGSRSHAAAAEYHAAGPPDRVARRTDAGAAGPLLPPRLAAAPADLAARLRGVRATPLACLLVTTASQISPMAGSPPKTSSLSSSESTFSFCAFTTSRVIASSSSRRVGLRHHRLAPRRHRLANHHAGARSARHRAGHHQAVLVGINIDDAQVADRHPVVPHAARPPHPLQDARRVRRLADRSGCAVEHRAVGRAATGEP